MPPKAKDNSKEKETTVTEPIASGSGTITREEERRKEITELTKSFQAQIAALEERAEKRDEANQRILEKQSELLNKFAEKELNQSVVSNHSSTVSVPAVAPVPVVEDPAGLDTGPSGSGLTAELNPLGHYLGGPSRGCSNHDTCLLYTSPSPRDLSTSRMPSSA